jgi:hypothetical protein
LRQNIRIDLLTDRFEKTVENSFASPPSQHERTLSTEILNIIHIGQSDSISTYMRVSCRNYDRKWEEDFICVFKDNEAFRLSSADQA